MFWKEYVYLFPRAEKVIPTGFGEWKFGALEVIGIFIFRDKETFQKMTYERLAAAMTDISLEDKKKQEQVEQQIKHLLEKQ